jgi:signal transduction histidine kinase
VLFLLLAAVMIPSTIIFWLTNRAADREAEAAQREVQEAYRGQLGPLRDRVESAWQQRAQRLSRVSSLAPAVVAQLADSVVLLNPDGSLAYPIPLRPLGFDSAPRPEWSVIQAQIRGLVQQGQASVAVTGIEQYFVNGSGSATMDSQGRSIAADELLLAVQLLPHGARRTRLLKRLEDLLKNYATRMPSAQRAFLMAEAKAAGAGEFPTLEAERLALRFLESDPARATGEGLMAANTAGVWRLAAPGGRVVALFRTETVERITREAIADAPNIGQFRMVPPGKDGGERSVTAGVMLPGWQLAFAPADISAAMAESERRRNFYLWIGYVAVTALVVVGLLFSHVFRRRMQLARLKTDLVATVSHELKTPLASMRLLVDALLEEEELDPVRTREYLALIAGENQRLTGLVENFLAFSRIERQKLTLAFRRASPEGVVQAAVAAMRERFEQNGGSIAVDVERGLPMLHADPDALTTVLINLLDNAFKYSPDEKRVRVRAYRENGRVIFAVADSGIGIATEDQQRIFREFYRVEQSMASETTGCGLGLHIVDYIVKAHGGQVRVASELGQGSTFSVVLPEAA